MAIVLLYALQDSGNGNGSSFRIRRRVLFGLAGTPAIRGRCQGRPRPPRLPISQDISTISDLTDLLVYFQPGDSVSNTNTFCWNLVMHFSSGINNFQHSSHIVK